ncbi:MAG: hypothetical protein LBG84_06415 [Treponema sp.]|jgi:hypothetical protein|nr:hypothetical protein [Treponema sp.]
MKTSNGFLFNDFFKKMIDVEQRLINRRKRIEENMNMQNKKQPVIDVNGRYHAPYDGYQWNDGNLKKNFLGGEYLPVDDFTEENRYYKLSKIIINETLDIPYPIVKEMVDMGLSQKESIVYIKRHNQDKAHYNERRIKVITCEIITSKWHFDYLLGFIEYYIRPLLKSNLRKY